MIFDYNVNDSESLDVDELFDAVGNDWGEVLKNRIYNTARNWDYIDEDGNYTYSFIDLCDEFRFHWC